MGKSLYEQIARDTNRISITYYTKSTIWLSARAPSIDVISVVGPTSDCIQETIFGIEDKLSLNVASISKIYMARWYAYTAPTVLHQSGDRIRLCQSQLPEPQVHTHMYTSARVK
jgi:hypothetical protein